MSRAESNLDRFAMILTGLVIALAILPLFIAPDPTFVDPGARFAQPGEAPGHPLGTDPLGRDALARLGMALRTHLLFSAGFIAIAVIAARLVGRTRFAAALAARPGRRFLLILALAVACFFGGLAAAARLSDATGEASSLTGDALTLLAPPALVAGLAIATARNRAETAALAFLVSALWGLYLALSGFGPPAPTATFPALLGEFPPYMNEIAHTLAWLGCALVMLVTTVAGYATGRRLR